MYRTKGSATEREDCEEEILNESIETEENHEDILEKFNFVMTIDTSNSKKQILPKTITLEKVFETLDF